jgi:hypothetical protein
MALRLGKFLGKSLGATGEPLGLLLRIARQVVKTMLALGLQGWLRVWLVGETLLR